MLHRIVEMRLTDRDEVSSISDSEREGETVEPTGRPIDSIIIGSRIRSDLGDLDGLATSLALVGMLQPVVVDADGTLIAGRRRIEAAKRLGWTEVPTYVVTTLEDARTRLVAERDENTERKPMTPSELVMMSRAIEAVEAPRARQRRIEGNRAGGLRRPGDKSTSAPTSTSGRDRSHETRRILADAVGIGRTGLFYARKIVDRAEQGDERAIEAQVLMDTKGQIMPAYEHMIGHRVSHRERDIPKDPPMARARVVIRGTAVDRLLNAVYQLNGLSTGLESVIDSKIEIEDEKKRTEILNILRNSRKTMTRLIRHLEKGNE